MVSEPLDRWDPQKKYTKPNKKRRKMKFDLGTDPKRSTTQADLKDRHKKKKNAAQADLKD